MHAHPKTSKYYLVHGNSFCVGVLVYRYDLLWTLTHMSRESKENIEYIKSPHSNVLYMTFYLCLYTKLLQSCPTLCDPMDPSPPGFSVHGILQARILECVAMPSSRGSFWPRDGTCVSCGFCIAGRFFTTEPPGKPILSISPPIFLGIHPFYAVIQFQVSNL